MEPILPLAEPIELKKMTGLQKAAALMLALGKEHGAPLWNEFSEDEAKELSSAMATLGSVPTKAIEHLFVEFATQLSSMASCHGSYETTERLLSSVLPTDKVRAIMEEIRGPNGRTMWDKLANVSESVLAAYLKNEHPQTVAVILSKLKSEHSARILTEFEQPLAVEVVNRMLKMEPVSSEVLQNIEETLRSEFINNLARSQRTDPHESMAEMFNALDRSNEERLLGGLEALNAESAEKIRSLMFTFDDLAKMTPTNIQVLLNKADKKMLTLALKGATEQTRDVFYSNLSERARKMLREDIGALGPVRLRDVEESQQGLVKAAKKLAEEGEIELADSKAGEEELVY
jgi:flagellar motor switch protein FliG